MSNNQIKNTKGLYYFIGVCFSILGFIGGIVLAIVLKNFLFCLLEWVSIFLFVAIYFGIGTIIENQVIIHDLLIGTSDSVKSIEKAEEKRDENKKAATSRVLSANEWKCPQCGKINQNYVGTCGCGTMKP